MGNFLCHKFTKIFDLGRSITASVVSYLYVGKKQQISDFFWTLWYNSKKNKAADMYFAFVSKQFSVNPHWDLV